MKLELGNAYELIKNIPDKSIDLIYTDIPYETEFNGGGCLNTNVMKIKQTMTKLGDTIIKGIDYSILDDFVRVLKKIYCYIWCSKSQIQELINYFVDKGCNYNILVWCKDNPVPYGNSMFVSDLEYCLCFYEKGIVCKQCGVKNKSKWYISHINTKDKKLYEHPTIKPLDLVERHLINSTDEGDVVLDCFMGSGTTGVACKELGRDFIGFEINKDFYDVAVDRINGISKIERDIMKKGQISLFDNE